MKNLIFQFTKSFYSARNFLKENSFFDKVYIGSLVKKYPENHLNLVQKKTPLNQLLIIQF
jgi:hypothetical protein